MHNYLVPILVLKFSIALPHFKRRSLLMQVGERRGHMEYILNGLIALSGMAISILIATAKAKAIEKVTAKETAEAELIKNKS